MHASEHRTTCRQNLQIPAAQLTVHAVLLKLGTGVSLGAELEILLLLLSVPLKVEIQPKADSAEQPPLFMSGTVAAAYACSVLHSSGQSWNIPLHNAASLW